MALGIAGLYAASRFWGLTKLPVFTDEGAFIQLAARVWNGDLFEPIKYGKLLHVWIIALVLPWTSNPLWAARSITACGGFLALYACVQLGARLFSIQSGLLCAALYVICPFTLFHDRMALSDGLLSTFAALTVVFSIALVQDNRRRYAYLLSLAMTGAILSKMPGLLTLLTPIVTVFLIGTAPRMRVMRKLAISYFITFAICIYPVAKFILTTRETEGRTVVGAGAPALVKQFLSNVHTAYDWLFFYWTPPILFLGLAGLVLAIVRRKRRYLLLGAVSFIPIFAFVAVSTIWFPRYILLATVPMLALVSGIAHDAADFLASSKFAPPLRWLPATLALVLVFFFAYRVDWLLIANPAIAPLPNIERVQYMEAWPSGYGVAEAADYLRQFAARSEKVIVVTHHDFGDTTDFGLSAYFMNEKRIAFRHLFIRPGREIAALVGWSRTNPTFVVLNRPPASQNPSEQPDVAELLKVAKLVASYPKPGGRAAVDLYSVNGP